MTILNDKDFLQHFWDLALDDYDTRLKAAQSLIESIQSKESNENEFKEYKEYTLKRLIRGLPSPRDAARLGFATALVEVLKTFNFSIELIFSLLDENTKISGSLKGSEERDLLFGKLFGYLAIIRSGILANNEKVVNEIVERIIQLHNKKIWIQELTAEALFLLLHQIEDNKKEAILDQIIPLVPTSLTEATENHITLLLGLHQFTTRNKFATKLWNKKYSHLPTFDLSQMNEILPSLIHSANKFPKIHRIWDYLLSFIVPMNEEGELTRPTVLSSTQQDALKFFVQFVDDNFWKSSKEKRALAMKLNVKLIQLVPSEYFPFVLTETMIHSIVLARLKKENLLYDFTGSIVKDLIQSVGNDSERILSLSSAFSQFGGVDFDKRTNTNIFHYLLGHMDDTTAIEYIKLLCELIGTKSAENDQDPSNVENLEENNNPILSSLSSLFHLAKLDKFSNLELIRTTVLVILSRISFFQSGSVSPFPTDNNDKKSKKNDKKDKKSKSKDQEVSSPYSSPIYELPMQCLQNLEESLPFISKDISQFASKLLIQLLSDVIVPHQAPGQTEQAMHIVNPLIGVYWQYLAQFFKSPKLVSQFRKIDDDAMEEEEEDDDEEEGEAWNLPKVIQTLDTYFKFFQESISSIASGSFPELEATNSSLRISKFCELSMVMIILSLVQYASSSEMDFLSILSISVVLKDIAEKAITGSLGASTESGDEDDEEGEEDASCELRLFESSIDVLSITSEQLKCLREVLKKLWSIVFSLIKEEDLSQSFFDVLVGHISDAQNEPTEGDGEEPEAINDEEVNENDVEEKEEDDEEIAALSSKRKGKNQSDDQIQKKSRNDSREISHMVEEIEEDQEVVLPEEQMMDYLLFEGDIDPVLLARAQGLEDNEDDQNVLMHSSEADEALIKMLQSKQDQRKKGFMALKRRQILLRTRTFDIFEILINRLKSGNIIYPLIQPLMQGYKRLIQSKITQDIPEGKTFTQRYYQFLTQTIFKKKITIKFSEEESQDDEILLPYQEETNDLVQLISQFIQSNNFPALRTLGQEAWYLLSRCIFNTSIPISSLHQILHNQLQQFITIFATRRHHHISLKFLEDLFIHRFATNYLSSDHVKCLIDGYTSSKILFNKCEVADLLVIIFTKLFPLKPAANKETNKKNKDKKKKNNQPVVNSSLQIPSQQVDSIFSLFPSIATALKNTFLFIQEQTHLIQQESEGDSQANNRAKRAEKLNKYISMKRLKPILLLLKLFLDIVYNQATTNQKALVSKSDLISLQQQIETFQSLLNSLYQSLSQQLSPQFQSTINELLTILTSLLSITLFSESEAKISQEKAPKSAKKGKKA